VGAERLRAHALLAVGAAGRRVGEAHPDLDLTALDERGIGAMAADGGVDLLVLLVDPHGGDAEALVRVAALHDVPTACNPATADLLLASPLFAAPGPE